MASSTSALPLDRTKGLPCWLRKPAAMFLRYSGMTPFILADETWIAFATPKLVYGLSFTYGGTTMQIQGPAHVHGPQAINAPHQVRPAPTAEKPTEQTPTTGVDQLDISPEADLISRVRETPEIRADRVAQIRAEIAAGVYETDEKLDVALDRLLDEIA